MVHNRSAPREADESGHVVRFRKRHRLGRSAASGPAGTGTEPLDDLARYEQDDEEVDYRQRMLMNIIAVAIVTILVGVGVWIADTIATMQKDQDCVLQGRANCAPIEVPIRTGE